MPRVLGVFKVQSIWKLKFDFILKFKSFDKLGIMIFKSLRKLSI